VRWFRSGGNSKISILSAKYTVISAFYEFNDSIESTPEQTKFLKSEIEKAQKYTETPHEKSA
jgi:hypothetical protein